MTNPPPSPAEWRRAERQRCVALRKAAPADVRQRVQQHVRAVLDEALRQATGEPCFSFYWPIRGEVSLLTEAARAIAHGATAALPVVVGVDRPLVFRRWTPRSRMLPGTWNIPEPVNEPEVEPSLVLAPVVGFDDAGYRLGNGGGYYDRTLASLGARAFAIGVGMECLRLPTIHPQPHDVPMKLVVTELPPDLARVRCLVLGDRRCASPPCDLDERDLR
jgi:5,10-methenyltetrahydrofolate synthetase